MKRSEQSSSIPHNSPFIPDPPASSLPPPACLVIGYGNELRGDDAAGPRVASAVAALGFENVRVLIRHQLTPELAEDVAQARAVILVDASVRASGGKVRIKTLRPSSHPSPQPHVSDPHGLLRMAEAWFGQAPRAWLVTVPARNLDYGAPLSPKTRAGIAIAISETTELIRNLSRGAPLRTSSTPPPGRTGQSVPRCCDVPRRSRPRRPPVVPARGKAG